LNGTAAGSQRREAATPATAMAPLLALLALLAVIAGLAFAVIRAIRPAAAGDAEPARAQPEVRRSLG
jgi:predicted lipid-binding transport protein (Tim44 family)